MKKHNLKIHKREIFLSGILALLLVGCSNGEVIKTKEQTLGDFYSLGTGAVTVNEYIEFEELIPSGSNGEFFAVSEDKKPGLRINSVDGHGKEARLYYDSNYHTVHMNSVHKLKNILVKKNAHLEFSENNSPLLANIVNKGNVYFTKDEDKILFEKGNEKTLLNYGNIYAINDEKPKELTIAGNYIGKGTDAKIYLGLYVDGEKNISTDKLHVTHGVQGKTKVHFVFDRNKMDKVRGAKLIPNDYVIKAKSVKQSEAQEIFSIAGGNVPVGNKVYELIHESVDKKTNPATDEVFAIENKWKLMEKK